MRDWPHSPVHRLDEPGAYLVTGSTYLKKPIFRGAQALGYASNTLLGLAEKHSLELQAWVVFPNHYHFVALSPCDAASLTKLIQHFHSLTAIEANRWHATPGRKVWFQYWETKLTFAKSYFARLSYVHRNAVHHRLVLEPSLYRWCSAGWFERRADVPFYRRIMGMKIDRVRVEDPFEVDPVTCRTFRSEAFECGSLLPLYLRELARGQIARSAGQQARLTKAVASYRTPKREALLPNCLLMAAG